MYALFTASNFSDRLIGSAVCHRPRGRLSQHPLPVRALHVLPNHLDNLLGERYLPASGRSRKFTWVEGGLEATDLLGPSSVQVENHLDFLVRPICDRCDNLPGETMLNQYDIVKVVILDNAHHILNCGFHTDILRSEMDPVSRSR